MTNALRKMLFVSPRFLFPVDSGGKIRTTQILRGMLGKTYHITLASPAPPQWQTYTDEIAAVCDEFEHWPERQTGALHNLTRLRHLLGNVPVAVATDRDGNATRRIHGLIADHQYDVIVYDFPHAVIYGHPPKDITSVLFTHNVESEIFKRHVDVATNVLTRWVWRNQYRKMLSFEAHAIKPFHASVAVSQRDKENLERLYGADNVGVIRTGVDLDFFPYSPRVHNGNIVFTGAMDWMANIDAIEYMIDEIWPLVIQRTPNAKMTVVGRNPPDRLVERAQGLNWTFTGFVDDVRPYVRDACAYAIPLRVGGGTRLKVFEAMAMGAPMVSTSIGVEGLQVEANQHYLKADNASSFANALCDLVENQEQGDQLSVSARKFVEENFSHLMAAKDFEAICSEAFDRQTKT